MSFTWPKVDSPRHRKIGMMRWRANDPLCLARELRAVLHRGENERPEQEAGVQQEEEIGGGHRRLHTGVK